jgi:hypothetical protein
MKLIHINESVFNRLLEDNRRPPFQDFYESVVSFVDGIRRDPIGAVPNDILKGCGLHNGELRKKLYDYGIITKEERIDEPYDETTGRKQSRYYVKYDWNDKIGKEMRDKERIGNPIKKSFIRKLYNDFFGINENITRDEINMMLNSPLTIGVISDGRAPEYVKQATDIYNNKINKKRKKYER